MPLWIVSAVFEYIVMEVAFFFLAPLDEKAFVAGDFPFEFGNIDIGHDYPHVDETLAIIVSAVEENGAYQSFENISVDVLSEVGNWNFAFDETYQIQVAAEFVKVFAADDFRTHLRKVAFIAVGNLTEKMGCNNR